MIQPNKLFNKRDYDDPHFSQIKEWLEELYANLQTDGLPFEYSDWNRAWEYAQLVHQTVPQGKSVLDIGSGKSLFPILLAAREDAFVTSVDLEDVQDRYTLYIFGQEDIDVVKADAQDLPFKDSLFDIVYMASVI